MTRKHRWMVLGVSTFSFVTLMVAFSAYPIIADDMAREMGLTYTQMGLIMSAFSVAYAVAQIPAGILSDRYGGSKVASLSVTFLCATAFFFSQSYTYEVALISRALTGLAGGFLLPATMKLLPQWFPPREIDKAMGVYGTGQGTAFFITFLTVPFIVERFEWRMGFNFSTVTASAAAVLSWLILRDLSIPMGERPGKKDPFKVMRAVNRRLLLLTTFNFTAVAVFTGVLTWTPVFLTDVLHLSLIEVGYVTAVIGVTNILASFASGVLSPSVGGGKIILASMAMCVVLPYLLYFSSSSAVAFLLIALIGWATMFYFGPTFGGIPNAVEARYLGLSFGIFNTLTFVGSALSPALAGLILDYTSRFDLAFLSISMISLTGLFGSLLYRKS